MMWLRLFAIEILKTRRSLSLLLMVASPLMIVSLFFLMALDRGSDPTVFSIYWAGVQSLWTYLMAPLYIALVAASLNATEHKNGGWRLMLSMPIHQWQWFLVKAFLAWLFFIVATIILYVWGAIGIYVLQVLGIEGDSGTAFEMAFTKNLLKLAITCLPVVLLQHLFSWRFSSFVSPLALAIIMTVINSKIMSSSYWVYDPWSYMIMSTMGGDLAFQEKALWLGGGVGLALLIIGTLLMSRREVKL